MSMKDNTNGTTVTGVILDIRTVPITKTTKYKHKHMHQITVVDPLTGEVAEYGLASYFNSPLVPFEVGSKARRWRILESGQKIRFEASVIRSTAGTDFDIMHYYTIEVL